MVTRKRNMSVEEIGTDTPFEIDALRYQTIFQKVIFWGNLGAGILENTILPRFFEVPRTLCIMIFLVLLMIGIGYGCNYTKDLTYKDYIILVLFKPAQEITFGSGEDVNKVRKMERQLRREEADERRRKK